MYTGTFIDQRKHFGKCYFKGNVSKMTAKCDTVIMSCGFPPNLYSLQSMLEKNILANVADKLTFL